MPSFRPGKPPSSRLAGSCQRTNLTALHLWPGGSGTHLLSRKQALSNWAPGQGQAKKSSQAGVLPWGCLRGGGAVAGSGRMPGWAAESYSSDASDKRGHCRPSPGTEVGRGHSRPPFQPRWAPTQMPADTAWLPLAASRQVPWRPRTSRARRAASTL